MRTLKKIIEANLVFRQGVDALLLRLGARPGAELGYDYTLDTPCGELWVRAIDSDTEPWLACMFRDVDRAKGRVSGSLNPYSGKWNHMNSDLVLIEVAMVELLRLSPR